MGNHSASWCIEMIGNIIYALHDTIVNNPIKALAATGIFGFSKNQFVVNLRYGLGRVIFYTAERAIIDSGGIGRMLYEDLKVKKGGARPPIWKGSPTQKAATAGRQRATAFLARAKAPLGAVGRFLISAPARPYLLVGAATIVAGYAVGRTRGVRTAPPINTRFVMGAPM